MFGPDLHKASLRHLSAKVIQAYVMLERIFLIISDVKICMHKSDTALSAGPV